MYWQRNCEENKGMQYVKPADYEYRMQLGSCSMRNESCRQDNMLYEVIKKYTVDNDEGRIIYDVHERVTDTADLDWPNPNATVQLKSHLCRTVCVAPDACELTAGAAWTYDLLEDLGIAGVAGASLSAVNSSEIAGGRNGHGHHHGHHSSHHSESHGHGSGHGHGSKHGHGSAQRTGRVDEM